MSKICRGCGAELQFTNNSQLGYIPENKYNESNYCERCFKITHYNEKQIAKLENINDEIIIKVNKEAKYVYFMLDFLNINSETITMFKKINMPKTLIISKYDIIPRSIKESLIIDWLRNIYQIKEQIIFQSSKNNINTKSIINFLKDNNILECHILGFTNAGKSTLINRLCQTYNNEDYQVTTSAMPNTTVGFVTIIIDGIKIIDSPGFTLSNTVYAFDDYDLIKKISPKKFLKPITYQVKEISSIIIENIIRINSSTKNSLTFYMSNDLNIKRVFCDNNSLTNKNKVIIDIPQNSDLIIKSLGFINIKEKTKLTIYCDNQELLEVRKSLFSRNIQQ